MAFGFGLALAHNYRRAGGGFVLVPTKVFDFRTAGALDPLITFTRSGTATYIDSTGAVADAAANAPRFDYDPATLVLRGLLMEDTRANRVARSEVTGVTLGVIGAGGVMPTNWGVSGGTGLVLEVVGTGTDTGLTYVDLKMSGVTASTFTAVSFGAFTGIVTAATYSGTCYVSLRAGSVNNFGSRTIRFRYDLSPSGTVDISGSFTPTSTPLLQQRISAIGATAGTLTGGGSLSLVLNHASGVAIDMTLRVAAPQLEFGLFPTSYIKTAGALVTRSTDSAIISGASFTSFWNALNGTLAGEWTNLAAFDGFSICCVASADDNTTNERIQIRRSASDGLPSALIVDNNVVQMSTTQPPAVAANTIARMALTYKLNDSQMAAGGLTPGVDAACTMPTVTQLQLGFGAGLSSLNGHLRRFNYYNTRLPAAQLQAITA